MISKPAILVFIVTVLMACTAVKQNSTAADGGSINWKKVHVMVYTKNGKGYVHQNINAATTSIKQLAAQKGFSVDVSDNPADFTDDNLKKIFDNKHVISMFQMTTYINNHLS